MFNKKDPTRNAMMLTGPLAQKGYDWWWHSFTGIQETTGEEKAFFIEFFLCNPEAAADVPVYGCDGTPSYLMVKAGCWGRDARQLHRFFAWKDASIASGSPYSIQAADCFASDICLRGSIESTAEVQAYRSDVGSMSWDLTLDKQIAFNVGYGADDFFRSIDAFEMYWHAEGMKTLYSGTVTLDGEVYRVLPERSFGYADKNWGSDFTSPWVWLSSSDLTSRLTGRRLTDSVFDIGGGRPKVFNVPLERKLLGAFWYEGTEYEYNFSHVLTGCRTQFSSEETETEILWHVRQENHTSVMETEVRCLKADMLLIRYESPDGASRHNRLWNGGNGTGRIRLFRKGATGLSLIDDIDVGHIGCEYGEYGSACESPQKPV